jgi:hypothetical protein
LSQDSSTSIFKTTQIFSFFTKEGFLKEDGKADVSFIVKTLEGTVPLKHYQLQKLVSKCSKFKTNDGCENAYRVGNHHRIHLNYLISIHFSFSNVSSRHLRRDQTNFDGILF